MNFQTVLSLVKKFSFLFFFIFISCSDNNSSESNIENESEEIEFKVMSYNISGGTFSTHKDSIISLIKKNSPDILGAQELSGSIKSEFLSLLGLSYSIIETFPSNVNISTHNIIYNNRLFNVTNFGYFETETCGPRRFINWALLKRKDNNEEYYIYNTHLCNSDLELRKQHLIDLVDLMDEHKAQFGADYKAILTGDFNSGLDTEFIQFMLGKESLTINLNIYINPVDIIDTWREVNLTDTKPSQGEISVDWIFSTPNIETISSSVDMTGTNSQNEFPSDHSPVITVFK
ncbi:endonuclease/exonuclease/phosphatase family protein [Tenacibaculum sp.]|uniref:endonuclease/exonuclease/phosphatase family protein n=1 Tax=Tenacibaculum sp. TaxID=1906242 RepID=UPI003D0A1A64